VISFVYFCDFGLIIIFYLIIMILRLAKINQQKD